ncbi:hypothetical protein ABB37_09632 [Leptomonas pyrrhocoris]|uniref:Nudix hydrolase domain-containing protein n=1 Tax=Leptomonas pyrrhocoris TaxID=157538 RepID=A0A0M9FQ52_LEPPY|nr:hypothetical protein ABB37_09632 [Leptomonas pyrrhocoris]XP_015652152.1 hypothetical protein ABB37_09632 [Leptomonas pyrrhocoris]KPA73712.1 hypothetical protein ABB37_09632 [Leptomonas pyrrhocoris]KPA73713.1 hypothetical protein ABB37_09632 [Leptomonas pyrrhocoris]|eukprot:XP_015652151.1 hypothetical protein ABB37_09632 [Leptomonas pyrrhocoris]
MHAMTTAKEYALCFLTRGDDVLLLNRLKSPFMGSWNGVGGKRDSQETPLECAHREVEETEFAPQSYTVRSSGRMQWTEQGRLLGVLHLYLMELHAAPALARYPESTREGILAFRPLRWVLDRANTGGF